MYKIIFALLSLSPIFLFAQTSGLYFSTSAVAMYGSGSPESLSSLFGPGVAMAGGFRINSIAAEIEFKKVNLSNTQIGNKHYDSRINDSLFLTGFRLFPNRIFSLKAGIANHFIEMDISKNHVKQSDNESDGEFLGFYAGMGISREFSQSIQGFLESTLYPLSEINIYLVDMQIGLRFYL